MRRACCPPFCFWALLNMIPAVIAVRNAGQRQFPDLETFDLEQITNIVEGYTKIDTVEFIGYNTPPTNPIWGEFYRFNRFIPYKGNEEVVQIRYATHLSKEWLRFVITKELCHALDDRSGTHTVSAQSVSSLITILSLISGVQSGPKLSIAAQAEKLAEICAMEILIPISVRRRMIASGEYEALGPVGTGAKLELPSTLVADMFDSDYMQIACTVFS